MSKKNFIRAIATTALAAIGNTASLYAQTGGPGVELWKSFLPYNQVNGVATDGSTFFCSTNSGFFTYNREDGSMDAYSKVNGMSDIGMTGVAYDKTSKSALLAYSSSNIDIFKDGTFYNLPDLKIFPVSGQKTIFSVYADDGMGYLSTGIGLLIINMTKRESKTTVRFTKDAKEGLVYGATTDDTYVYAATSQGLYRINKGNPFIQNDKLWTQLDTTTYRQIANANGNVYVADTNNVFQVNGVNNVTFLEHMPSAVSRLDPGIDGIWISNANANAGSEKGYSVLRSFGGAHTDSIATIYPSQVVQLGTGEVWYGDQSDYSFTGDHGLRKKTGIKQSELYIPNGPVTNTAFDVSAYNGEFWLAHGTIDFRWDGGSNHANFSSYSNDSWNNINYIGGSEWFQDFSRILKDPATNKVYAASWGGGLWERDAEGNITTYRGDQYLSRSVIDQQNELYFVSGLALDPDGNLWMSNNRGLNELVVKTRDGQWYKMKPVAENSTHNALDVIVDDYGQKWFLSFTAGGAIVYNDNGTIENTADDDYRVLKVGAGAGNLPDNNTLSIAKDKDGAIWIGTVNGIGIVNCPDQVIKRECESSLKVVQLDEFAGYLFAGQSVGAIAVDGANRKWIGTTNGIWLISVDGEKIIYRFNEENSPLPSNNIKRINIDPVTGDVYVSTEKGLVSFRSTATEGKETNDDKLYIYPNPVPSGFEGMIAVRGVAENSDVRFTDISGQLVYKTKALGGQAVWNGKDYSGRKVQSGVYLVFVVNKDGTQKATGKLMIHR